VTNQKYIILDRDGVINVDLFDYVTKPADFKFEDGSLEALSILSENNFNIVVATNQACISLGIASRDQIDNVNSHMKQKVREHGSDIIHIEVCPHKPEDNCECRKPKTGLLLQAEKVLDINLKGSYFIGDKFSDVQCALAHECKPLLVKTGYGEITLKIMILLKLKFLKIYCQQQNLSANDFICKIFSLLCGFRNFFSRHIFNLPSLYFY